MTRTEDFFSVYVATTKKLDDDLKMPTKMKLLQVMCDAVQETKTLQQNQITWQLVGDSAILLNSNDIGEE